MYNKENIHHGSLCLVEKLFGRKDSRYLRVRRVGRDKFYLEGSYCTFDLQTGRGKTPTARGKNEYYRVVKILNPINNEKKRKD